MITQPLLEPIAISGFSDAAYRSRPFASAALAGTNVFPGASAQTRLLVSGTQTTVAIRLRFKGLPWTTTTGRRNPGPNPAGSGNSAHQTSPCLISTTRRARTPAAPKPSDGCSYGS